MSTHTTGDIPRTMRGQVLALIRDRGPMSRAELARQLALSATTITRTVTDLEADKLLEEGMSLPQAGAGRPAINLHIRPEACRVAAVQIGIGNVQVGLFDALGKRIGANRFENASDAPADAVLHQVAEALDRLCEVHGQARRTLDGIGVAVPGPVDADGRRMQVSIRLGWRDTPVADALEALTGLPVTVEHNVRAMALAEARFGRARGLGSIAFVYLRSGLGAGLVVEGQPFSGGVHGAIELGHLQVVENGMRCICGGRGCIETVLSETALQATTRRLRLPPEPNALTALWHAAQRRADVAQAVDGLVAPLATGLSALTTLINPELVLLGGALADIPEALLERIVAATMKGTFPAIRASIRIERSQLGADAGLAGGATVALERFLYA